MMMMMSPATTNNNWFARVFCAVPERREGVEGYVKWGGAGRSVASPAFARLSGSKLEVDGKVYKVKSARSGDNVERADVVFECEEGEVRLWLGDRLRWARAIESLAEEGVEFPARRRGPHRGAEASALTDSEIEELGARLEEPVGWYSAIDAVTGREYFYSPITGESRWRPPLDEEGFVEAWADVSEDKIVEVELFLQKKDGPLKDVFLKLLECPIVKIPKDFPELMIVSSPDAEESKRRIAVGLAEMDRIAHPDRILHSLLETSDFRELPWDVSDLRRQILARLGHALTSPLVRRKLRQVLGLIPRRTLFALSKVVSLERVVSFVAKRLPFFAENYLLRSNVSAASRARDECVRIGDRERAKALDSYVERSQKVVETFANPLYQDLVCAVYPQLFTFETLDLALESVSRALSIFEDEDEDMFSRLRCLDDELGRLMDSLLGVASNLALTHYHDFRETLWWLNDITNSGHQPEEDEPEFRGPLLGYLRIAHTHHDVLKARGFVQIAPVVWAKPGVPAITNLRLLSPTGNNNTRGEEEEEEEDLYDDWYYAGRLGGFPGTSLFYQRSSSEKPLSIQDATDFFLNSN